MAGHLLIERIATSNGVESISTHSPGATIDLCDDQQNPEKIDTFVKAVEAWSYINAAGDLA